MFTRFIVYVFAYVSSLLFYCMPVCKYSALNTYGEADREEAAVELTVCYFDERSGCYFVEFVLLLFEPLIIPRCTGLGLFAIYFCKNEFR